MAGPMHGHTPLPGRHSPCLWPCASGRSRGILAQMDELANSMTGALPRCHPTLSHIICVPCQRHGRGIASLPPNSVAHHAHPCPCPRLPAGSLARMPAACIPASDLKSNVLCFLVPAGSLARMPWASLRSRSWDERCSSRCGGEEELGRDLPREVLFKVWGRGGAGAGSP